MCTANRHVWQSTKKFHFSAVHVSSACLKIRNTNQSLLPILRPSPAMHRGPMHRPFWQRPYTPSWYFHIKLAAFSHLLLTSRRPLQQIINLSNYVIYQSISRLWMNYEYSCDKSAISLVNTHLCRPLSDAGRCRRTSKCRSNRTMLEHRRQWRCVNARCRTLCEQRRLNNVFNYSVVVRRRTTSCGVWTGLNSSVVVSQLLYPPHVSSQQVVLVNRLLKQRIRDMPRVHLWRHWGFWSSDVIVLLL